MDAGTILGGTSLAIQVLGGCLAGYEVIESSLVLPEESRYLSVRFQIERDRLRNFSEVAGLPGNVNEYAISQGLRANRAILLSTLSEMKQILDDFAKKSGADGSSDDTGAGHSGGISFTVSSMLRSIQFKMSRTAIYELSTTQKSQNTWSLFRKQSFLELLQKLERLNDHLRELLDDQQHKALQEAQRMSNMSLLQTRNSVDELRALQAAARYSSPASDGWYHGIDAELENLAAFKTLHASLLSKRSREGYSALLAQYVVELQHSGRPPAQHLKAVIRTQHADPKKIWISRRRKEQSEMEWNSKSAIEELTVLLMAPKPDEFCLLPCLGYCDLGADEQATDWGLVFQYPENIDPELEPISLLRSFERLSMPSLTQRVSLAQKISRCLMYLHSVNWLHKGLRSDNIIFFQPETAFGISSPYLTGFEYSRRARFNESTTEVPRVGDEEVYRHPDVQVNGPRLYYRKTFDIYSLGIILIEIALWKPIASIIGIADSIERSPQATSTVQERLLTSDPSILEDLRGVVGDRYVTAVKFCISGRNAFGLATSDLETSVGSALAIQQLFHSKVVRVLQRICV